MTIFLSLALHGFEAIEQAREGPIQAAFIAGEQAQRAEQDLWNEATDPVTPDLR